MLKNRTFIIISLITIIAILSVISLRNSQTSINDDALNLEFIAYKATYDIDLGHKNSEANISSAKGRMTFEVEGSKCEGYTLNSRLITRFTDNEGKVDVSDLRSTSWEKEDGKEMYFNFYNYINGNLSEEIDGIARKAIKAKEKGKVIFKNPKKEEVFLNNQAIFPMEHNKKIMLAAINGKRIDKSIVFDGFDKEEIYLVVTFIGKAIETKKSTNNNRIANDIAKNDKVRRENTISALSQIKSWPLTVSYFKENTENKGEETPEQVINFILYKNGVSDEITFHYDNFSLKGKLVSLEYLPQNKCEK